MGIPRHISVFFQMDTLCDSVCFLRSSGLLKIGLSCERKNCSLSCKFFETQPLFEKGGNNENGRVTAHESVSIHLNP